jgi:hypothetical protein
MSETWTPLMYLVRFGCPARYQARLAVSGLVSPDRLWGVGASGIPGELLPLQLTHIPSGEAIGPGFDDIERAQTFAAAIAPLLDWRSSPVAFRAPPHVRAAVRETYARITGRAWDTGRPLSYRTLARHHQIHRREVLAG